MKKIRLGLLMMLAVLGLSQVGVAQEVSNGIKLEPLSLLKNQYFQIGYERALSENMTIGLNVGPQYSSKQDSSLSTGISGIAFCPQFRFYPTEAMGGGFIGVYSSLRFNKNEVSDVWQVYDNNYQAGDTYSKKKQVYIFGLQGGFSKSYNGFLVDVYFGFGYKIKQRDYINDRSAEVVFPLPTQGIATRGNISFGYAF